MNKETVNNILQWTGTAALMTMYVIMNFYPDLYPYNIIAGLTGGLSYFVWSYRVANKPQMIVNMAGILVCVGGLIKFFG
jgi:hypothetical protein